MSLLHVVGTVTQFLVLMGKENEEEEEQGAWKEELARPLSESENHSDIGRRRGCAQERVQVEHWH